MHRMKHNAPLSEVIDTVNDLVSGADSIPPRQGNGKKYIGGGAVGVAVMVIIWLIQFLISQNTEMVTSRTTALSTAARVAIVESDQHAMAEILRETSANTKVLAAQVESIVDRLARMDRKADK